jgi:transcriptional regulator with XRE-family HTH domain
MTDRERAVCARVRQIREQMKWSQIAFAGELGISRPKLVSIEFGHTPLRYDLAVKLSRFFDVQTKWLATGNGEMHPYVPLLWTAAQRERFNESGLLTAVYDFAPGIFEPFPTDRSSKATVRPDFDFWRAIDHNVKHYCYPLKFRNIQASWKFALKVEGALRKLSQKCIASGSATRVTPESKWAAEILSKLSAKQDLTKVLTESNMGAVKPLWPELKRRLQKATAETGKKSELAKFLKTGLTVVSRWLTDDKSAREPGAEYALQMLHWVERQERQK